MEDPKMALDTKVREELGSIRTSSARRGARRSRHSSRSRIGAVIPLLPFLLTSGTAAFVAALRCRSWRSSLVGAGGQHRHRPQPALQRHSPGSHRRGGGGRHVRRGHAHRCECRLIRYEAATTLRKVSNRRPGATDRATATASTRHDYDKVLVATAGSIIFHLTESGQDVELGEGQRLDLPAGRRHAATVGAKGVSCLEAHLPAGSLAATRAVSAGVVAGASSASTAGSSVISSAGPER